MRIAVLMSTYQGEKFILEQMHSILHQLPSDGRVLVRDDGSTDGTVELIHSLGDQRITVISGQNVGFVRSFFALLEAAPEVSDVVMLADQDDVWLPGKIARAYSALANHAGPTLYCSRLKLVDAGLQPLGLTQPCPRGPSFANALAENIVTGCTVALNRSALELVLIRGDVKMMHFHDWWMYLVVSAFGEVLFDETPTILYRQHGGNVVGRGAGIGRYLINLRFVVKQSWVHMMFSQIENFRLVHSPSLPLSKQKIIDRSFSPRNPRAIMRLLLTPVRHRQFVVDEVLLRLMILVEIVSGRGLLPHRPPLTAGRNAPTQNGPDQ